MNNSAEYDCIFGPDLDGQYIEERVESNVALNCDTICTCTGLTNNTCLFGPDDKGHFYTDNAVSSEQVDSCTNDWCMCNTHANVIALMEEEGLTFEEVAEARVDSAVDNTVRPGEEEQPVTPVIIDRQTG